MEPLIESHRDSGEWYSPFSSIKIVSFSLPRVDVEKISTNPHVSFANSFQHARVTQEPCSCSLLAFSYAFEARVDVEKVSTNPHVSFANSFQHARVTQEPCSCSLLALLALKPFRSLSEGYTGTLFLFTPRFLICIRSARVAKHGQRRRT